MAANKLFLLLATIFSTIAALFAIGAHTAPRPLRPIVFIPGILGSKLCDAQGKVLWGNVGSLANLGALSLAGAHPRTDIKSCGIINEIQVLGPFWAIHQYDGLLQTLARFGYHNGENLFIFDYDWRQSNFDSAKGLAEFIHRHIPEEKSFDIVAHSMGGLVTRIYIHDAGVTAERIHTVFYMGTPFLGSANTFGAISDGWGAIENVIAGGKNTIRETVLSFPGFLELLPRYDKCCYVREVSNAQRFLDIFQASTWVKLSWLPSGQGDYTKNSAFAANLRRAASLDQIMSDPAQHGIREVRVAGDAHSTKLYLGMGAANTRPEGWVFTKAGGDGTVPKWSAANNLGFDSLAGTLQSFSEHATIFDDKWVQDQLMRELTNEGPPTELAIAGTGSPTIKVSVNGSDAIWTVNAMDLEARSATVSKGSEVEADLIVLFDERDTLAAGIYHPTAKALTLDHTELLKVVDNTSPDDVQRHRLRYVLSGYKAEVPGVVEVTTDLGQIAGHAYVAVLP